MKNEGEINQIKQKHGKRKEWRENIKCTKKNEKKKKVKRRKRIFSVSLNT